VHSPALLDPWFLAVSLAFATLLSEDLACAAAGAIVAEGRLAFAPAVLGCFGGIVVGDLLLFAVGRTAGRQVLQWAVIQRRMPVRALESYSEWIDQRGAIVVLLSRFAPGTRLPTYLVAGALRTDSTRFVIWFLLAAALWTPLIVGASIAAGTQLSEVSALVGGGVALTLLLTVVLLAVAIRSVSTLGDRKIRRRLIGRWRRLTRWEFWPMWVVYPPVLARIALLMIHYRGMNVFTAANPAIPGGGLIGESKFDILCGLSRAGERVARAALLPAGMSSERRLLAARQFIDHAALSLPVVLKPDKGQRGSGVTIVRTPEALASTIRATTIDLILQEYAPGQEFGVFYVRHPDSSRGRIISITEKRFPHVVGDGRSTLEELILADERAVCLNRLHCRVHQHRLGDVPTAGETVPLVEIGSHCRGALFLDALDLLTPEMEEAFDAVAKGLPGFCFGRFDVRTPSVEDFRRGRNFKIVELNGVTSEATHIYDPSNGLLSAYRVLFAQWRIAFEIGAANISRGALPTPGLDLLMLVLRASIGETQRPGHTSKVR
jgi:membrane protein DedA with SNARE-associated domain